MVWNWTDYKISDSRTERELEGLVGEFRRGRSSIRMLDIGRSTGVRTERIVLYTSPARVVLLLFDIDETLLNTACCRTRGHPSRLDDGPFELITCFSVLEVLPDEQVRRTLEMFSRLLAPRGLLLIQHSNWHPLAARTVYWQLRNPFRPASRTHAVHRFSRNYGSVRALLSFCEQAGFRVNRIIRGPYHGRLYLRACPLAASSFNIFAFGRAAEHHNESCLG